MVKVHLCKFLSFACQVKYVVSIQVGPVIKKSVKTPVFLGRGQSIRGTPCFCFSLQERERGGLAGCKMVAHWLKLPFG